MGCVVLDRQEGQLVLVGEIGGPAARQIAGVTIAHDIFGADVGQPAAGFHGLVQSLEAIGVGEVALVGAEDGSMTMGEAEGIFQFTTDGQHRRQMPWQVDGQGCEASGAADGDWVVVLHHHHGIIAAEGNIAIVIQKAIDLVLESGVSGGAIGDQRRAGKVGGGEDEGIGFQQQVVQGRVGEHEA